MTLRHLEIFLKVADTGSMRAAAEELFITQPTVSGSVAELEKECNALLFERLNKRLYITDAGKKLKTYARKMLSLQDEIIRQIASAEDNTPLNIGATVTIGTCVIPEYISKMEGIKTKVLIDNTAKIEQGILNNTLDIGLVEGRISSDYVIATPFMRDEMMLICREDNRFAKKTGVTLEEIKNEPMILREENSGTRVVIDEAMEAAGVKVDVLWNCNNTQAILNAVRMGIGVSILSPRLLEGYAGLSAVPIQDVSIERDFQLLVHKDKYISRNLEYVIELIMRRN